MQTQRYYQGKLICGGTCHFGGSVLAQSMTTAKGGNGMYIALSTHIKGVTENLGKDRFLLTDETLAQNLLGKGLIVCMNQVVFGLEGELLGKEYMLVSDIENKSNG